MLGFISLIEKLLFNEAKELVIQYICELDSPKFEEVEELVNELNDVSNGVIPKAPTRRALDKKIVEEIDKKIPIDLFNGVLSNGEKRRV